MPPPNLQIYFRPRVTLTFDLLIPKLIILLPRGPLVPHGIKIGLLFSKCRVHEFRSRRTNEWTNERAGDVINHHFFVVKIMLVRLPVWPWRRHKKLSYTSTNHLTLLTAINAMCGLINFMYRVFLTHVLLKIVWRNFALISYSAQEQTRKEQK